MAAAGHLGPVLDVKAALRPGAWRRVVFGEESHPYRHVDALSRLQRWMMTLLVVGAHRGIDGLRHPVDRDVGEQLVFGVPALDIAIAVTPRAELFDYPGGEPRGRVVQPVAEGLRLRRLDHDIRALLVEVQLTGGQPLLLGL